MNFKVIFLLLIAFLSACNDTAVHSKDVETNQLNSNADKQSSEKLKRVLDQLGPLDGKAVSLEPLEVEKCFGQTYEEQHIRDFLAKLYRDKWPVSGMGLFLGVDKKSFAIKNKEYRYNFIPGKNEAEKEIFVHVFRFSKGLYRLIGFKDRWFDLTAETKKEIRSVFDVPAIYLQSAGDSIEEIRKFKPYEMLYWNIIERDQKDKVLQRIEGIKKELINKLLASQKRNSRSYDTANWRNFSVAINFSQDRFDLGELGLKGFKLIHKFVYGYYAFQFRNDEKLSKENIDEMAVDFQKPLLLQFYGATVNDPDLSGVPINTILKIKDVNESTFLDRPSAFEKSLFLSIYERIKPLNMEKTEFIRAVLTVMQPCLDKT